ncbi:MAG: peptidylprolyl isomerase [Burkholderiaceae bacterium]
MFSSCRRFAVTVLTLTVIGTGSVASADAFGGPRVALNTSAGDIVLELNSEKAPKSVENFIQYVKSGQYNGTVFHRVINGFMIQGGGLDAKMQTKRTRPPIPNESNNGLKNEIYTVAMARSGDPGSATSQFYINVANNASLDYPGSDGAGYAVFGKVVTGTDVVDKIKTVATTVQGINRNVPVTPIVITSARILP